MLIVLYSFKNPVHKDRCIKVAHAGLHFRIFDGDSMVSLAPPLSTLLKNVFKSRMSFDARSFGQLLLDNLLAESALNLIRRDFS